MLKRIALVAFALLAGSGAARAVSGSYQNSCDNIRQRGPFLMAECETRSGDYRRTSIDVRRCPGDVENSNGRLTCGRDAAERNYNRGGGYGEDDAPPRPRYFRGPDPYQDDGR